MYLGECVSLRGVVHSDLREVLERAHCVEVQGAQLVALACITTV